MVKLQIMCNIGEKKKEEENAGTTFFLHVMFIHTPPDGNFDFTLKINKEKKLSYHDINTIMMIVKDISK